MARMTFASSGGGGVPEVDRGVADAFVARFTYERGVHGGGGGSGTMGGGFGFV